MIKLILFDNDGTLADSVPRCLQATNTVLADAGFPLVSIEDIVDGMRLETPLRMMSHAGIEDHDEGRALAVAYHRHSSPLVDETRLFPGVQQMLSDLNQRGYSIGAVSNNRSDTVERVFRANGISDFFPVIIGEDNAVETKPGPGGLLQACRLCGYSPDETVYVGDGPSDSVAAKTAGIISVGVKWNVHDTADISTLGFDYLIERPSDLPGVLGRL